MCCSSVLGPIGVVGCWRTSIAFNIPPFQTPCSLQNPSRIGLRNLKGRLFNQKTAASWGDGSGPAPLGQYPAGDVPHEAVVMPCCEKSFNARKYPTRSSAMRGRSRSGGAGLANSGRYRYGPRMGTESNSIAPLEA